MAHILNLCVVDAIKAVSQISELITKCRAIVTYFNQSSQAAEKLKSTQKQMGMTELKMKQDNATRWNAILLIMVICLIKEPL